MHSSSSSSFSFLHLLLHLALMDTFIIITISVLFFFVLYLQWSLLKQNKRLPPGSMGWPYIGETLKLFSENPKTFFSKRQSRYGNIFKSHILGCPSVMVSSPEAAKKVLVTQAQIFKPTYPLGKERLIGPQAIFFHQGSYHSNLKKLLQSSLLPASIKTLLPHIQNIVLTTLPSWKNKTINTLTEMKRYSFDVAMIAAFGINLEIETDGIKRLYHLLEKGYNSMPFNFPGTPFYKSMKARKRLDDTLRKKIHNRRESGNNGKGLLGVLLGAANNCSFTDTQIVDNIIGVIFAAHDTTASALTWIVKNLNDNRDLLRNVMKEQEEVKRRISLSKRSFAWEDTRQMPLTNRFMQETLRMASILSFTYREAVEDVEFDGYSIPKGWKVLPLFRNIHHCAKFFPNHAKFDPSRFEVAPIPYTFMPFGNGVHSCPGNELAKLEILLLLHHLITTYRWEVIGDNDDIKYNPFPVPKDGLPIKVTEREEK